MHKILRSLTSICLLLPLLATQSYAEEGVIEEVVVTGSYIRKTTQADSVSPITNIDRASIDDSGILTSQELFRWLPSNTGSENQADSLTQGGTTGTANVNLRGLGLGSTLVLVNGRRQTVTSSTANGGDTFVDINSLMPFIMVENIEVLKDGAAAIYGSDAVAGVVNYKTRSNFEGLELRGNFQSTSRGDDHQDQDFSVLFGAGNDRTHVVAALKYFERDELFLTDRPNLPRRTESGFGNPGSYLLLAPSAAFPTAPVGPGTRTADPDCELGTGSSLNVVSPTFSECRFDFGPSFTLAPEEKRLGGYLVATHDVSDNLSLFAELGYSNNETTAGFSTSFPAFNFPVIGADHPGNPFGAPVVAFYRPIGDAGGAPGGSRVENSADNVTQRFVFGANGGIGDSSWTYDLAYTFSENRNDSTGNDQVGSRLDLALAGFGGTGCDVRGGTAGQDGCLFFNPFGSAINAQPGDPEFNTPEVLAFINSNNPTATQVDLVTYEAVVSGDLFQLQGGTAGIAIGAQRREESRDTDRSEDAEREDLAFLVGGPDVSADQSINAFFAELFLPLLATDSGHALEAQLAVRYEDYDTGFDSTDPKIGLLYRYNDRFSARFTWGTAFRAPTLFQLNNEVTALNASADPFSGSFVFIGNTASPNPNLVPEEAETFNIGFTYAPLDNLEFSLDYYNVEYEDRLVQESGQQVLVNESIALGAAGCDPTTLFTPACQAVADPNVIRDPNSGAPVRVFVNRFNAASAETDGVDFSASWFMDTDVGTFSIQNSTSYVASFDLQQSAGGPTIDGAGSRNESNPLARSIPELRSNTTFSWTNNRHQANAIVRYIDSYEEEAGGSVDSWTVLDLQYSYRFDVLDDNEATVTIGVLNATDEDPPEVAGNLNEFGYDTKVHDARGSVWYARFVYAIP